MSSQKQKTEPTGSRKSSPNTSSLKSEEQSKQQTSKATTSTASGRLNQSDTRVPQKKNLIGQEKLEGNDFEGLDEILGRQTEILRPSPSSTSLSIHSKASDNASVRSWAVSSTSYQKLADIDERDLEVRESKSDMCLPRLKTISSSFKDLRPIVQEDEDSSSESSYILQRQDRKKKFRKKMKVKSDQRQASSHDSDESIRQRSTSSKGIKSENESEKLNK